MATLQRTHRKKWEINSKNQSTSFSVESGFYHSTAWRKCRKSYIISHPLCECEQCKLRIVPLPAEHVDHIKPIRLGGDPFSWDNLQSLNKKCHNKKSANEKYIKQIN